MTLMDDARTSLGVCGRRHPDWRTLWGGQDGSALLEHTEVQLLGEDTRMPHQPQGLQMAAPSLLTAAWVHFEPLACGTPC